MERRALSPFRRERILRQGVEAAFEEMDLPRLLGKVVERACVLLRADHGAVGLVEGDPAAIRIASAFNMPEGELGSVWTPGEGLAGRILESEALVIANRYGEIAKDCPRELRDHAVIGVPIRRRRRMVGYFGIGASPPRQFCLADARLLGQFARACGGAIENARLLASTRSHLEDTKLQYELSIRISTASEVRDIVRAYLLYIARSLGFVCTVVLYEFSPSGERTHNIAVGQWSPGEGIRVNPTSTPHVRDEHDPLLDAGQPVWFRDVRKDRTASQGLRAAQARDNRPAVALVPLVSSGRRIGLVVLSDARPVAWDDHLVRPIVMTANHLAAAIDSRQEHARLEEARESARVSHERQKIARELHDSVTQMLFAVHVECQSLGQARNSEMDAQALQRLQKMTTSTLREMRGLLQELRPAGETPGAEPKTGALEERLRLHAREIGAGFELHLEQRGAGPTDPAIAHTLFRIGQEALTNAHRHAGARTVRAVVERKNGCWILTVGDDGRGMSRSGRVGEGQSFGLRGMAERAKEMGGTLKVGKNTPRGTLVTCSIPVEGGA